eukprot:GAHX01002795.1.p1 GENE.GAHX01002795.1~~GAHX01002795.1.p1  ORF type:complete len:321 (-),score=59.82 GAHX01002795.1:47-1009(-)
METHGNASDDRIVKEDPKASKQNYMFYLSFIGTGYLGSQYGPDIKSVEGAIFEAVCKTNYLKESNKSNPDKNGFKRTSRVDKGVHAVMFNISMKLQTTDSPDLIVETIQKHLPESIQLNKVLKVSKRFKPRFSCKFRKYKYVFPHTSINNYTLERANKLFSRLAGNLIFWNFTNKVAFKDQCARRDIKYIKLTQLNEDFTEVKLKGVSFMKHQIRKMVGLVLCVIHFGLEDEKLEASLTEQRVLVPKAPSQGLYLYRLRFLNLYDRKFNSDLNGKDVKNKMEMFENKLLSENIMSEDYKEFYKGWLEYVLEKKERWEGLM